MPSLSAFVRSKRGHLLGTSKLLLCHPARRRPLDIDSAIGDNPQLPVISSICLIIGVDIILQITQLPYITSSACAIDRIAESEE